MAYPKTIFSQNSQKLNGVTLRHFVPDFTQIVQEMWRVRTEMWRVWTEIYRIRI